MKTASRRRLIGLIVAAPVTMVLAALVAAQAGGATVPRRGDLVRILSPADGQLVTLAGRRAVTVRVRTSRNAKVFRAFIGLTPVTGSFSRPRHGVRSASFRVGTKLHLGKNILTVRSFDAHRSQSDAVAFTVVRRRGGLLSVKTRHRLFPRQLLDVVLKLRTRRDSVRAKLNGHSISSRFATGVRRRAAALDVDDGLRYGRNALVVTASNGRFYDRVVRSFIVRRVRALVGAGQATTGRAGIPLKLDATRSRPAQSADSLRYSWRIIRKPRSSRHARLRGATTARPTFVPDVHGRYTLQVTVRETGPKTKRGGLRALTAPPSSDASSTDTVTISAQPSDPPMGASITTIPANGSGITVHSADGPMNVSGNGIQMLVLWRDTLEQDTTNSGSFPLDAGGLAQFNQAISRIAAPTGTSAGELIVLTGAGNVSGPLSSGWLQALEAAYRQFGGTLTPFGSGGPAQAFASGEWSLIGVKGMQPGQAAQDYGTQPLGNNAGEAGSLNGYLQLDSQNNYTFNFGQYIPFDTNVPGPTQAFQNTISIGSQKFTSQPLPGGTSGYHVLVLAQGNLRKIDEQTYPTNDASGVIQSGVNALATELQGAASGTGGFSSSPQRLVIVQSIGDPGSLPSLQQWIAQLGGIPDVFMGKQGLGGGYTLVGGNNLSGFGAEESATVSGLAAEGLPARLTGILEPNRQDQYDGDTSNPTGSIGYQMNSIAYQPPQAWPVPSNAAQQQAMACIASNWGTTQLIDRNDVHADYYLEGLSFDWTLSDLAHGANACVTGGSYGPSFSCPTGRISSNPYTAVYCELRTEIPEVRALARYFTGLQNSLTESNQVSEAELAALGQGIATTLRPPSPDSNSEQKLILGILSETFRELGEALPEGSGVAAGGIASALQNASEYADDPSGNNLARENVVAAAANLGKTMAHNMNDMYLSMPKVYDLLVSDYGKLFAAGNMVGAWQAQGGTTTYIDYLQQAAERWFYGALVPVAYDVYNLSPYYVNGVRFTDPRTCLTQIPPYIGPPLPSFQNVPNFGWITLYGGSKVLLSPTSGKSLPESLLSPMFNPSDPGWFGLNPQSFFNENFQPINLSCSSL